MIIIEYDSYDLDYYCDQWRRLSLYKHGNRPIKVGFCYNIDLFFFCNVDGIMVESDKALKKNRFKYYCQQR